jgi:K+-transporting ATPase KdpF subunit
MKRIAFQRPNELPSASATVLETTGEIFERWQQHKLPRYLFLGLCFNLVLAPAVFAATGGDLSKVQAYWLAGLGLVTVALFIYLFFVMFVPEKF